MWIRTKDKGIREAPRLLCRKLEPTVSTILVVDGDGDYYILA